MQFVLKFYPCFSIILSDLKDISQGIELFNQADFFSAHDFFEKCWLECENEDKLFFQGLVQISVGCFHLISGNSRGSISQFNKGILKLNKYLPVHGNVNLEILLRNIEILIKVLTKNTSVNSDVVWNQIPKIEVV